jgi:hypothetical protein
VIKINKNKTISLTKPGGPTTPGFPGGPYEYCFLESVLMMALEFLPDCPSLPEAPTAPGAPGRPFFKY